jgi:hypothetical protein
MKKFNWDEDKEKFWTVVLGVLGTLALLINLFWFKGFSSENLFDSIKDFAGLGATIIVFFFASKMFYRNRKFNFYEKFEEHLKEWADQNKYLINPDTDVKGTVEPKRAYQMVLDHSNIVTRKNLAKNIRGTGATGNFVYLPLKDKLGNQNTFVEFRLNAATFERQTIFINADGKPDLKNIAVEFAKRINDEFSDKLGISAKSDGVVIMVSLEGMDKTDDNAKKLIDMIEFVKTMYLALA